MRHHTKDKGDSGLGFVVADCLRNGVQVALPISEHLPFDCIAISECGKLVRVQVKYRAAVNGGIRVDLRSGWTDRHGVHKKHSKIDGCDAVAVFCPDTSNCYYVRRAEFLGDFVSLRIEPSKNYQVRGVRRAPDFIDPLRMFAPVV